MSTTHILRIDSSLFGDSGVSTQLNDTLLERLTAHFGDTQHTSRDLAKQPLPHFSAEVFAAISSAPEQRTPEQAQLAELADQLIAEVLAADILVVAAPMYNFGVPSTLKAWIDYIARPGVTFRYTNSGPEGLLLNKTVYVVATRGGVHKGEASDTQTPYLRTYFNFLGITDVRFIYAEGINMGQKEPSMALAAQAIQSAIAA